MGRGAGLQPLLGRPVNRFTITLFERKRARWRVVRWKVLANGAAASLQLLAKQLPWAAGANSLRRREDLSFPLLSNRRPTMLSWFINNRIDSYEKELGVSLDYMKYMYRVAPGAFF